MNMKKDKQRIIDFAESLNYKLDYDRYDDKDYPNVADPSLRFMRFISKDESLDEPDLRWIWYKDDSDDDNINRGKFIRQRLDKKKQIQDFLKY